MCHATPSNPPTTCCRFLWPFVFHVKRLSLSTCSCETINGGSRDPRSRAWPQKRQRPKVGNDKQSGKMLGKACESKGQEQHTFIRCSSFGGSSCRARGGCSHLWRVDLICCVLGIFDSTRKLGSHGACRQNKMGAGSRLKLQETRVANISCGTLRTRNVPFQRRPCKNHR